MISINKQIVEVGNFPNKESYISLDKLNLKVYNRVEWAYEEKMTFKDPITDDGIQKSAKGAVAVVNGELVDELTIVDSIQIPDNLLRPIFRDGVLLVDDTLQNIRDRVNEE